MGLAAFGTCNTTSLKVRGVFFIGAMGSSPLLQVMLEALSRDLKAKFVIMETMTMGSLVMLRLSK